MIHRHLFLLVFTLFVLAGCAQAEPAEPPDASTADVAAVVPTETMVPPTATTAPTDTPEPTDTATPEPTATSQPTDTPTPVPTVTDTPAPTATETATPTPVPTATNTPTPLPPPPTPVPQPAAPVFESTEIMPFSRDRFSYELNQLALNLADLDEMYVQISFGHLGSCIGYLGLHNQWTTSRAGFTDVPASWQSLYADYRGMVHQAVAVSSEIYTVCSAGGGTVSEETDAAVREFLAVAQPQLQQMIATANGMP